MSLTNSPFWMAQTATDFYGYTIDNSLRFDFSDQPYLQRTMSNSTSTWTWSAWVKRSGLGSDALLFGYFNSSPENFEMIRFDSSNRLWWYQRTSGTGKGQRLSSAVFRDVSSWYHIVVKRSGTSLNMYVNGEELTAFDTSETIAADSYINEAVAHRIGRRNDSNNQFHGYMAEVNFIDGTALDPTSFGETKSGIWIPKVYSGSYGTNGFYLKFANSAAFGTDSSGNGNTWSATNLSTYDQMPDSPTNNFVTLNPLAKMGVSNNFNLFQGNLTANYTSNTNWQGIIGNMGVSSGKWYFEVRYDSTGEPAENRVVGWSMLQSGSAFPGGDTSVNYAPDTGIGFKGDSGVVTQGSATSKTNSGFTHSEIIGLAIDLDNRTVDIYKNNVDIGGATNIDEGTYWPCVANYKTTNVRVNFGQDSSFAGIVTAQNNSDDNGIGDFYYTPPSGYLAMCSANLPAPTFSPADDNIPEDYFNTVLYTGNGSSQSVTGVGFKPDLVWIKDRSDGGNDHKLYDFVRGQGKELEPSSSDTEYNWGAAPNDGLYSFDSDGFSVGSNPSHNTNTNSYVAWTWLGDNTTGTSNTDGSITSTVNANTDAGFSIATYTGNATSGATVGHGLGVTPEVVLIKARARSGGSDWTMYHKGITNSQNGWIRLNITNAWSSTSIIWNNTAPSSSVVTLGSYDYVNDSGTSHVMYSFAEKEGYSKFGKYTGNGSSDGPFVYTDFRPAWLMIKRTDSGGDWIVYDNRRYGYNGTYGNAALYPNDTVAEEYQSSRHVELISNGYKVRTTNINLNATNGSYIYMAFAEQPFKYSNAR